MRRGKRDVNPVFLKIGIAFAFSLGGMIYTFIRRIKPSDSRSDRSNSSDCNNQGISRRGSSEHDASHRTPNYCEFDRLAADEHEEFHNCALDLSPNNKLNADKDYYLLPEFNDLVKEFSIPTLKIPDTDSPSTVHVHPHVIKQTQDQEIKNLKNTIKILKERERKLEIQLLEYYGLKEQENAVMELQNRLKLNKMESKILGLKIESLQADNKRLESQMADYNKVLVDLEDARVKIKDVKKKFRIENEQNEERILDLKKRVRKMEEDERRRVIGIDSDFQLKVCKLKDLEGEAEELRKSNYDLQVEKSKLIQRLEHVQNLATSVLEEEETEKLKKESQHLRKKNEDLTKEIEKLQAERCDDAEELVYLRWINACLRYELRNYQPGTGKTMARDLSKTLSPKSENKAKQLILEYANKEGGIENSLNIPEIDSDHWSSPQSSNLTDSGELDESLIDYSLSRKSNHKFFGKLVKFLRGKDSRSSSVERTELAGDDMNPCSNSSFVNLGFSSRNSVDSQRSMHRNSDVGIRKRIDSIAEGGGGGSDSPSSSDCQKSELVKYAEVLKESSPKATKTYRRRSASFSSF